MYPSFFPQLRFGLGKSNAHLPLNRTVSTGIIGSLGDETSDEELAYELHLAGYHDASAMRIYQGKDKIPTSMLEVILLQEIWVLL
jgi:hypothetical protein